jgi:hypothetical protein
MQDSQTTKFTFADGSYGYTSTSNYYDAEGNVINFETGDYTLDNGEAPPATATNTGVADSVAIPSATNAGKINDGPIATGTVNQQTKPSEGSGASLRRGYGDAMIGIVGGLALGIVL